MSAAFAVTAAAAVTGAGNDVTPGGSNPLAYHLLNAEAYPAISNGSVTTGTVIYNHVRVNRTSDGATSGGSQTLFYSKSPTDPNLGKGAVRTFFGSDGSNGQNTAFPSPLAIGDVLYLWLTDDAFPSATVQVGAGLRVGS